MLGRDDERDRDPRARAPRATSSEARRSARVRAATWIGMNLAYRGAIGPASGWLGRAQRLLDSEPGDRSSTATS